MIGGHTGPQSHPHLVVHGKGPPAVVIVVVVVTIQTVVVVADAVLAITATTAATPWRVRG